MVGLGEPRVSGVCPCHQLHAERVPGRPAAALRQGREQGIRGGGGRHPGHEPLLEPDRPATRSG
jgi:hypothetical protein